MNARSSRISLVLSLLLIPSFALAHGGVDDEKSQPIRVGVPQSSRTSATTELFDLVAVVPAEGTPIRLFLSDAATNMPVHGATMQVALESTSGIAVEENAGVYELRLTHAPLGTQDATVSVVSGDADDLIVLEKLVFGGAHPAARKPFWPIFGAIALVLIIGAVVTFSVVGRGKRTVVASIASLSLGIAAVPRAMAHGGEDHGGGAAAAHSPGDRTNESLKGGVRVLKEAQFSLGIRTEVATEQTVVSRLRTLGRVVARPRSRAEVEVPQAGRLLPPADDKTLPAIGARVEKGEVLGYVQVVDRLPIRAPISGIVTEVGHGPNETVEAGEKLLTITDLSSVWVEAWVFEDDIGQAQAAPSAEVTSAAYPNEVFPAKTIGLSTDIVSETRSFIGRLQVANPKARLRLGMLVDVNFLLPQSEKQIVIPSSSVVERFGKPIVYVHRTSEVFEPRTVKLGLDQGGRVAIDDGLEEGDRVVVEGAYQVLSAQNAGGK